MDRCVDENDWIRREVSCAIEQKKNIIPVMLDGFEWPKEMPKGIEELPNYQAISAVSHEYFDMAIDRLKGYLISTPDIPVKRWLQKACIVLGVYFAEMLKVFCKIRSVFNSFLYFCCQQPKTIIRSHLYHLEIVKQWGAL
ncbi:hypothetical protein [uncultured Prevotella sp.]|uniref:hypothetical protein n=1 Tax=uncultured Prevotella sp. TaxID=159272 RepID=UPI0025FCA913|nr:hypothetical protein [uncultured Prevotella sp.]